MRSTALILVLGIILIAALAVSIGTWGHGSRGASAQDESPITVAIDMDPAGNTCPGDGVTDCTIGTIEQCRSVPATAGTTFDIDTVVTGLWQGYSGFNYDFSFPDTTSGAKLTVTAEVEGDPAVNLIMQLPGSEHTSLGEGVPDVTSPHFNVVGDLTVPGSETTPPWTQGMLVRYTFQVGADPTPGVYGFGFANLALIDVQGAEYPAKTVWDYNSAPQFGVLALGVSCPPLATLSPTPTPTVTPTVTPTATPTATPSTSVTPTPTGTPSPGTVSLVAGWNDSCYQGQAQDIDDAFAPVLANVQAVYRMMPNQSFDRWFPARPELSTITTLSPFDQLFILAGSGAMWTVQPLAELLSSTALNGGWNSVCYLGGGNDATAATAGISGAFSIIYSLSPDQAWRRYIPGQPEASTLTRLETFTSVLILMSEPRTWAFSP